jgi:hypothetical protein
MKRSLVTLLLLIVVRSAGGAQPSGPYTQNAVYFEFLGQGLLYSVNFDHRFTEHIALRAGISHFTVEFISDVSVTTIPIVAEYLSGTGNHHLEIGLGIIPIYGSVSTSFFGEREGSVGTWGVIATATLGYRYQPVSEGFLFRIGLTPLMAGHEGVIWGGASIGYAF